nr:SEC-C metal-binding domain-containing protein [Oscillospiraceae bacterium]
SIDGITQILTDRALELYGKREQEWGGELMREIERVILLKIVDTKWMAHIDDMDELKKGIGLRSYGQRNPVVEYRYEGFDMFDAMVEAIREDAVRMLFTVQVKKNENEQPAAPQREQVAKPDAPNASSTSDGSLSPSQRKKTKAVGDNDPCPCGSGKKYKKCCGLKK